MSLPGSDKYRSAPASKTLTWEQKLMDRARTEIRIEDVLEKYYEIHVPYEAVSWKVRCPYAYEHADGGLDKQFRVYSDSNTGWCFDVHGRIDNLRLYREQHPYMNYLDCAKALLDDFDIDYRRKSYQEVFEEIVEGTKTSIDYHVLVEAMKLFISSFPQYAAHEYDPNVTRVLNDFNSRAKVICSQDNSLEEVEQWYRQEKTNMQTFLLSMDG